MRTAGKPMVQAPARTAAPSNGYGPDAGAEGNALAALGARGMVRTQTQFQTAIAVQVPRELAKVKRLVVEEATIVGEDFLYSWTVKDKNGKRSTIEGTSIDGAMILARNWGNALLEPSLVEDAPRHWLFEATFIDLENGFTTKRLFRQRKSESHGRFDEDRALDIAFQIGQSKAIRNVVVNAVPAWLEKAGTEAAKASAEKKYEDMPKAIAAVQKYYAGINVDAAALRRRVGEFRGVDDEVAEESWVASDIVQLRAIAAAIKARQTTIADEFPIPVQGEPAPAADAPQGGNESAQPPAGDPPPEA